MELRSNIDLSYESPSLQRHEEEPQDTHSVRDNLTLAWPLTFMSMTTLSTALLNTFVNEGIWAPLLEYTTFWWFMEKCYLPF